MKNYITLLLLIVSTTLFSQKEVTSSQDFWKELSKHYGKAFEGKITEGGKKDDGFTGKRLVMHVKKCTDTQILISFNVGENRSRTWVLKKDANELIQLKHDHRKEDGSDDKVTMYGGKNSNKGSKEIQIFPADEETRILLPHAASNVWWITLNDKTYTYNLKRLGTPRIFTVTFDLTKAIDTPKKSWGW